MPLLTPASVICILCCWLDFFFGNAFGRKLLFILEKQKQWRGRNRAMAPASVAGQAKNDRSERQSRARPMTGCRPLPPSQPRETDTTDQQQPSANPAGSCRWSHTWWPLDFSSLSTANGYSCSPVSCSPPSSPCGSLAPVRSPHHAQCLPSVTDRQHACVGNMGAKQRAFRASGPCMGPTLRPQPVNLDLAKEERCYPGASHEAKEDAAVLFHFGVRSPSFTFRVSFVGENGSTQ